jgi:hypothetical protein
MDFYVLFQSKFPSGTKRSFNSMFGVTPALMSDIFTVSQKYGVTSVAVHIMWTFCFLKCYLPIDCLHAIWNVSYDTFNKHIWDILSGFDSVWNTIRFRNRFNYDSIRLMDFDITCIVDTTECYITRPSYDIQEEYYSGYKKRHTYKYTVICSATGMLIVFVDVCIHICIITRALMADQWTIEQC